MGGDYAPDVTVKGSIMALKELPESVELVLIGDEKKFLRFLIKRDTNPIISQFTIPVK